MPLRVAADDYAGSAAAAALATVTLAKAAAIAAADVVAGPGAAVAARRPAADALTMASRLTLLTPMQWMLMADGYRRCC